MKQGTAWQVETWVGEDQIQRVAPGDAASFSGDAGQGPVLHLKVAALDRDASRTLPRPELAALSAHSWRGRVTIHTRGEAPIRHYARQAMAALLGRPASDAAPAVTLCFAQQPWSRHDMNDRIRLSVEDGVATLLLNRPDKLNALDPAMFSALLEAGDTLAGDASLRAVVIRGEGRAFCAGLDMQSFQRMGEGQAGAGLLDQPLTTRSHGIANAPQRIATVWRDVPVPVIAAVHGAAFGGGLQLALGADIRIVAPDARLSVMEIKWGLVPDMAGIMLMRELARPDVVRELTFTGRQFSGEEALQIGFATQVSPDPHEEALALARMIARQSPDAIRAAKRLLNLPSHDPAAVLMAESVEQQKLIGGPNQVEAVRANLENRLPAFR